MRGYALALLIVASTIPSIPTVDAASHTLIASNFAWAPSPIVIAVGDSLTIVNATANAHSWVRDDGLDACNLPCTRTFTSAATIPFHCGVHPGSMRATLQVGAGVALTIAAPLAGATVAGTVTVNGAASHASATVTSVTIRFDERPPMSANLTQSGSGVTWTGALDSLILAEGPHQIVVRASASNGEVAEQRVNVIVDNPDRIDLRVTTLSAPAAASGTTASITYGVQNLGNVPSGQFRVRLEYHYHGTWRLIGETTAPQLLPAQSRTATMTWDPDGVLVGTFTLRATADPDQLIADADRTNNARTSTGGWLLAGIDGIDLTEPI